MHPRVVVPVAKGSSFPERDGSGAACPASGHGQVLQEQEWGEAILPSRGGMEGRDGWGWLRRPEGSGSQLLCYLWLPISWELGRLSEDTRSSPRSLLLLCSLRAPDWLTPALHPHGDHRGG